ncbi:MAG: flagellar FlbD family protein [Planctomycetota bacterium]
MQSVESSLLLLIVLEWLRSDLALLGRFYLERERLLVIPTVWPIMIKLTRLDGEPFVLNAELIRYVERRPDTFITLTSGDRIVVSESMDDVLEAAVKYQQQKHFWPAASPHSVSA